jgi:hypothetical protein
VIEHWQIDENSAKIDPFAKKKMLNFVYIAFKKLG